MQLFNILIWHLSATIRDWLRNKHVNYNTLLDVSRLHLYVTEHKPVQKLPYAHATLLSKHLRTGPDITLTSLQLCVRWHYVKYKISMR